jgi:glycosyltransferase involved in cell wall biosynthesis
LSGGRGNIYGLDRVCQLLLERDFDILFILNDAWVISYYLDTIKKNVNKKLPAIVTYFPVDSEYHDPSWYRDFDIVNKAFTYTQFGKRVVNKAMPEMIVDVLPHGVDLDDFYQLYENRKMSKTDLFGDRLVGLKNPEEAFIVLNANRNQPRKKPDVTIRGFSLFAEGKPSNVRLYMHCGVRDSSVDIVKQAKRWNVDDRLIFTNWNIGIQRVPITKLNLIFNACDIGINTSLGEGWGLTNVEHAVTGAVQVVPRHSACEELFSDCGLLMETITDITLDQSETVGKLTTPEEVARNLEILYKNRNLMKDLAKKGQEKFSRPEYQWSNIAEKFGDAFEEACS